MKTLLVIAAFALISFGAAAQEDDSPERDLNNALIEINSSNPLPVSHQAIEQSTQENDRELNQSENSGSNNSYSSPSSSDDADQYQPAKEEDPYYYFN
jgi:hypothetical protein